MAILDRYLKNPPFSNANVQSTKDKTLILKENKCSNANANKCWDENITSTSVDSFMVLTGAHSLIATSQSASHAGLMISLLYLRIFQPHML